MRIGKCQCSIFKEMYGSFLKGQVDQETKTWMEQHKSECAPCREWSKTINSETSSSAISNTSSAESKEAKLASTSKDSSKVIMALGFSAIIFIAVWAARILTS